MSRVSVAILTCNRKDAVLRAIESAYAQHLPDVEVIVADNGSTDGTAEAVRERYPLLRLIRLPRNLGCPGGRNCIYANCTGDYIVNLDDDGTLGDGALQQIVARFDADPTIGILALRLAFTDEQGDGVTLGKSGEEIGTFLGGASAFRRQLLDKIGYYPEDFFLFAEESYLAIRAMDAGYRIVSLPEAIMWHPRVGASASTRWDYLRYRNQLLVVTRLFPGWLLVKYLLLRIGSYFLISLQRGTFLSYVRAVSSALRTLPGALWRHPRCSARAVQKHFSLRGPPLAVYMERNQRRCRLELDT